MCWLGTACDATHTQVDSLVDVRKLDPPEWCNTDEARRNSREECERYYASLPTNNGDARGYDVARCVHDANNNTCRYVDRVTCTWPSTCKQADAVADCTHAAR